MSSFVSKTKVVNVVDNLGFFCSNFSLANMFIDECKMETVVHSSVHLRLVKWNMKEMDVFI